jgi:hypothetical protein
VLEVGLGELEVRFAVFLGGFEGSWESGESDACLVKEDRFGAGGVVEDDAGLGSGGDGLLIDDGGAGLAADGWESAAREGKGFADGEGRRVGWPCGKVLDGERGPAERVAEVISVGVFWPEVWNGGAGWWGGEIWESEVAAHGIVELHAHGGRTLLVWAAVDPVVALAVDEGEGRVAGRGAGSRRRIRVGGSGSDFPVEDLAAAVGGQGQERKRHGSADDGGSRDGVGELVRGIFAEDFVDSHGGPMIGGVCVGQEDAGQRGEGCARGCTGGEVQVVAQRVGTPIEEDGVFLVRVVACFGGVWLMVNRACGDFRREGTGALIGGEDDLVGEWSFDADVIDAEGFVCGQLIEG